MEEIERTFLFGFSISLPRTLKRQFRLALAVLTLLILGGGFVAAQALHMASIASRQLAEDRLSQMQDAQDVVRTSLLIERESFPMLTAQSMGEMLRIYDQIIAHLDRLDKLVPRLGQAGSDMSMLNLHQAEQQLRNTIHVLAGLHNNALSGDVGAAKTDAADASMRLFHADLQRLATELVEASQAISDHFTYEYRLSVQSLAEHSDRSRWIVLTLLVGSMLLTWIISSHYLGKHVLARLQQVSHFLRHGQMAAGHTHIPVQGDDEIGQMARAVEQFMAERQQLADAQREALQSARFACVGQLAAGIAHEINTPIQYIGDNLHFIQETVERLSRDVSCVDRKEDIQELALAIGESLVGTAQIARIVLSMKEFSHPGVSSKTATDINRAIENTLTVTHNLWKNVALVERDFDPNLPMPLCHAGEINQVFLNLIVNATQAIESSNKPLPGTIRISTSHADGGIEIRIADSGLGVPESIRDKIFEPFFTTKPVGQGTGQGLAICRDVIVVKHGGSIELSSQKGEGAEFVIRLPLLMEDNYLEKRNIF